MMITFICLLSISLVAAIPFASQRQELISQYEPICLRISERDSFANRDSRR